MKPIFVNGVHEYDFEQDYNIFTLYYSNTEKWASNVRGKVAFSIENTGDDYQITQEKKSHLNYSEMVELKILLSFIENDNKFQIAELTDL